MLHIGRTNLRSYLSVTACAFLFVIFLLNLTSSAAALSFPPAHQGIAGSVSQSDPAVSPQEVITYNRHIQINDRRSPQTFGPLGFDKDPKADAPVSIFSESFRQPFSWLESAIRNFLVGIMTTIRQYAQHLPGAGDYCS